VRSQFIVACAVQVIAKDYKIIIVRPVLADTELGVIFLVAEVCSGRPCAVCAPASLLLLFRSSECLGANTRGWALLSLAPSVLSCSSSCSCSARNKRLFFFAANTPRALRDRLYTGFVSLRYVYEYGSRCSAARLPCDSK
jgi:hypothetical protein